jgi:hypothetical protein
MTPEVWKRSHHKKQKAQQLSCSETRAISQVGEYQEAQACNARFSAEKPAMDLLEANSLAKPDEDP